MEEQNVERIERSMLLDMCKYITFTLSYEFFSFFFLHFSKPFLSVYVQFALHPGISTNAEIFSKYVEKNTT